MREPRPRRSARHRRPSNSTADAKLPVPGQVTSTGRDASSLQPAKATGLVVAGSRSFSEDEEDLLLRLHALLGNRWSVIAGRLPGRTDEEVKAYWDSLMTTTKLKRADYDNHRVLLQALLASPDEYGEQPCRAMQNMHEEQHRSCPGSDVAASNDDGVSDAGSSSSNRWSSQKDHLLN